MTDSQELVKPVSYTGAGATLLLPSQGCDSFAPKPWKRSKSSNRTNILLTTDSSMRGAIPLPLGERRNSILPSVATGQCDSFPRNGRKPGDRGGVTTP